MLIQLEKNAISIFTNETNKLEFISIFKDTREKPEKNESVLFVTSLQNLIVKIGLIVSKMIVEPKLVSGNFSDAIEYLGTSVLGQKALTKFLRATGVNHKANQVKHTLDDSTDVQIEGIIFHYNQLIEQLMSQLKMLEFKSLKLIVNKTEKNIFAEKRYIKHEKIANHKIEARQSQYYDYDPYEKLARLNVVLNWDKDSMDFINIVITSMKSKRVLKSIRFEMQGQSYSIPIYFKEGDLLKPNILGIHIDIAIYRNTRVEKQRTIEERRGILFKKTIYTHEQYSEYEEKQIDRKSFKLSNTLVEYKTNKENKKL